MPLTPTLLAAIPFAIWLYLLFARGNFWQVNEDSSKPNRPKRWPRVVVIVPARDEAGTISRSVSCLAKQDYPGESSVVVVDDHSSDGTAELARKAAEESGAARAVTVRSASELPPDWTGKMWATNEGLAAARDSSPEYFWLTDADIEHAPDTLRRLVCRAEKDSLDLTSLMVFLPVETLPERLLIPPFLYFFLMLYPPNWVADPKAPTAAAAGGSILLRREALERIGGVAAVKSEIIDDCALAAAVKKSGGKIWLGLTRASVSLRRYTHFGQIRDLIARAAFAELRYSSLWLLASLAALFVVYLLPWVLFFAYPGEAWLLVDTTVALMAASFVTTVKFYGLSWLWALTLPVAVLFYAYATCVSAVRYWLGRGGQWKGRAQAPRKH
ncbi:MAG TPA: glycosyltransferase [Candidatus Acidoferrum sp.]|nr:glycosyltransferase [Candidatus Acidoferrum sp.]